MGAPAMTGGFTSGRRELVEVLRQRSRPYLFSNTLPPPIVGASLAVFELLDKDDGPRKRVKETVAVSRNFFNAPLEI